MNDYDSLDAYLDDVARDPESPVPTALDSQTADVARLVVAAKNTIPLPDPAVQNRIWQDVLSGAQSPVLPRPVIRVRRWPRTLIGLAAALLVLILGVGIWLSGTRPVSAMDILARAARVATDPATSGLQSYQGIVQGTNYEYSADLGRLPFAHEALYYVWFQAPNKSRTEMYFRYDGVRRSKATPTPIPQVTLSHPDTEYLLYQIRGSDGSKGWYYSRESNMFDWTDPVFGIRPQAEGPLSQAKDISTLLQDVGRSAESVSLVGSDSVAGRAVYVVDRIKKKDPADFIPYTHERLKIDQQTYITLGYELLDDKGQPFSSWEYANFEVNPSLDASLFTMTPPAGAHVYDYRTAPDEASLLRSWQQAAAQVPFPVYRPTNIPTRLKPSYALANTDAHPIEQRYRFGDHLGVVMLWESRDEGRSGVQIPLGPYTGYYQEHTYQNMTIKELVVDTGDTRIMLLTFSDVTKAELIQLAGSLQKVEPAGTSF